MKKRGRPKSEFSKKKEAILIAGAELFHLQGYTQVSIDDICSKASASKMTFYRQFKDKADLTICLLKQYNDEAKITADQILSSAAPFSEKFKMTLDLNQHYREKMGLRFSEDLLNSDDPRILNGINSLMKKSRALSLNFVEMGKKEGFFNRNLKSDFILYLVEQVTLKIKDPTFAKFYPDFSERTRVAIDFLYFGLTSKGQHL